jgi:hypothetical protein
MEWIIRVVRIAPVAPIGWPCAIAPPSTLTMSSDRPNLRTTAITIAAKASLIHALGNELSSYARLITIENRMSDFGDDKALKEFLQFAVEQAIKILDIERARLTQCSSYPTSVRRAVAFLEKTSAILNSIRPRFNRGDVR